MPVVRLPADFQEKLNNANEAIDDTRCPGVAAYIGPNGLDRVDIFVGLQLDGFRLYENISATNPQIKMQFYPQPTVSCQSETIRFDPEKDNIISIQGSYFMRGSRLADIVVTVGDATCVTVALTDNEVDCRPPLDQPHPSNDSICVADNKLLSVDVSVGYAQYHCSCLQYNDNKKNVGLIVGLTVGLGVPFIVALVLIAVLIRRRQRRRKTVVCSR
jgi:hypothetical protein